MECSSESGLSLYQKRIEPLLLDERPKSCNQCHLSGVDLALFLREDPCTSMACLKNQGLVNFEDPESSVVLAWIDRANPESDLITDQVIREERDGFLEWITFNATCGERVCGSIQDACAPVDGSPSNCEVGVDVRKLHDAPGEDCSSRSLEQLFLQNVYAWRGRCFPCHFEGAASEKLGAPVWVDDAGNCETASLRTMHNVFRRHLVDMVTPLESKLLLKPLAVSKGGVEHGGGDKFHNRDDQAYQDFEAWILRAADCKFSPIDQP